MEVMITHLGQIYVPNIGSRFQHRRRWYWIFQRPKRKLTINLDSISYIIVFETHPSSYVRPLPITDPSGPCRQLYDEGNEVEKRYYTCVDQFLQIKRILLTNFKVLRSIKQRFHKFTCIKVDSRERLKLTVKIQFMGRFRTSRMPSR